MYLCCVLVLSEPQRSKDPVDFRIARFAADRHGVFSRREAIALGATAAIIRRRIETGRWARLYRNVYRLAGVPETWHQRLLAACLAWDGVASHRSAAAVWGLAGVTPRALEITVPAARRRRAEGVIVRRAHLRGSDVTKRHGIPVTTVARTLLDVAAVADGETLEIALDDASNRHLVTLARLRRDVDAWSHHGMRGVTALRSLVDERDPVSRHAESPLETRLHRLLRKAGIEEPVRQYVVRHEGRFIARVDLAFPQHRLALEADGYVAHSGRRRWQRDLARGNALTQIGWRVLRFSSEDMRRMPDWVVGQVMAALAGSENPEGRAE